MATKEKAKKPGTAVAAPKASAVVSAEAMKTALKQYVADTESLGTPGGNSIRVTQNKMFVLPDGTQHPGPIELVIVDYVTVREYYDRPYDKKNPCPPACAAVNRAVSGMTPMKGVPDKQSNGCDGCAQNKWESGRNGKGKACAENRHLAVLPPDADAKSALITMDVSPTALKAFDAFARSAPNALQMPLWAIITEVSFDPNLEYPSLRFGNPKPADEDLKAVAFMNLEGARPLLLADKDFSGYTPLKGGKKR